MTDRLLQESGDGILQEGGAFYVLLESATTLIPDPYPLTLTIRDRGHTATLDDAGHQVTIRERFHTATVKEQHG